MQLLKASRPMCCKVEGELHALDVVASGKRIIVQAEHPLGKTQVAHGIGQYAYHLILFPVVYNAILDDEILMVTGMYLDRIQSIAHRQYTVSKCLDAIGQGNGEEGTSVEHPLRKLVVRYLIVFSFLFGSLSLRSGSSLSSVFHPVTAGTVAACCKRDDRWGQNRHQGHHVLPSFFGSCFLYLLVINRLYRLVNTVRGLYADGNLVRTIVDKIVIERKARVGRTDKRDLAGGKNDAVTGLRLRRTIIGTALVIVGRQLIEPFEIVLLYDRIGRPEILLHTVCPGLTA